MARSGFKQIVLMDKDSLDTTPTNPIAFGITKNAELMIDELAFKPVDVPHKDWNLSNYDNFKIGGESLQPSIFMFKKLLDWIEGNTDAQIVTRKQSASAGSEDVFLFDDGNNLGLEFKYLINDEIRSCTIDLERAFPKSVFDSILSAAGSASEVTIAANYDFDKFRTPYPLATESPSASEMFTRYIKRSILLETKRKKKDINNISLIDNILITVELEGEESSLSNFISQRAKGYSPSFTFKEGNGGGLYDSWVLNEGVLVQSSSLMINEEDRIFKVVYKGSIAKEGFSFAYGTGNGGNAGDSTGTTGGTVTIG